MVFNILCGTLIIKANETIAGLCPGILIMLFLSLERFQSNNLSEKMMLT